MSKKRRFKTIHGAVRRIGELEKIIEQYRDIADDLKSDKEIYNQDRKLMARLAADGPCFSNPLKAMAAKVKRNEILAEQGMKPDGTGLQ